MLFRSPIFYFLAAKMVENAGVLFAVLYGNKEQQKSYITRDSNHKKPLYPRLYE
jgi:hypothetical protein